MSRGGRTFVQEYEKEGHPLHLLVNNAGANFMPEAYTIEGVPQIIQVSWHFWCFAAVRNKTSGGWLKFGSTCTGELPR